jgi:hypothetical protein
MAEAESIELLRLLTWHLDNGQAIEVQCKPDLHEVLRKLDEAFRMRKRRHREKDLLHQVKPFSQIGARDGRGRFVALSPDAVDETARLVRIPLTGTVIEGGIRQFALLLGFAHAWPPKPDGADCCPVCHGRELAENECCLWCSRTGVDSQLPRPTQRELEQMRRSSPRRGDGLAGGRGKARPGKKPGKVLA